jgi:transposase
MLTTSRSSLVVAVPSVTAQEARREMISMSKVNDIRRMRREGETVASIARKVGVSRDTVYRYLAADDLSPKLPAKRTKKSRLDPWRPLIESWLDEDRRCWHTAHRIWVRLTEEQNVEISEARVRQYVAMIRRERGIGYDQQFLDLDWAPGIAQADFGEADFYVMGARTRLSYFVLSFPFSTVGVAQVFASENAECV